MQLARRNLLVSELHEAGGGAHRKHDPHDLLARTVECSSGRMERGVSGVESMERGVNGTWSRLCADGLSCRWAIPASHRLS